MLDNIDTILWTVVRTVFNDGHLGSGAFTPARLADYLNGSATVADIKTILSQVALAVSIVFAGILAYVGAQRRILHGAAAGSSDRSQESTSAAPSVSAGQGALRERFNEIAGHLDSARENDWKSAVLEADKLVDTALKQAGFPGDTFGDRLTNIQPGMLVSLDGVWWAHRVRNRIAHEMDYFLRYTEARQAVSYFEAALSELQLL